MKIRAEMEWQRVPLLPREYEAFMDTEQSMGPAT